jgi:hypothetical protein
MRLEQKTALVTGSARQLEAFLAGDDACNSTGQELAIDAGITLTIDS